MGILSGTELPTFATSLADCPLRANSSVANFFLSIFLFLFLFFILAGKKIFDQIAFSYFDDLNELQEQSN